MHPLGLTFTGFCLQQGVAATPRSAIRQRYLAHLAGFDNGIGGDAYPVSRHVQEGDLTKFIQTAPDGLEIESVIIPMWKKQSRWTTLCVSSQVGCAMGCTFCETAQLGKLRNLTAAEIVGQLVDARVGDADGA